MPITDLIPAVRVSSARDYLRESAASFGIREIGWPERLPNTRCALAIAEFAREQGKLDLFRDATMDAYWCEGKNLEDESDLREIARRVGLAPDVVIRAMGDARYLKRLDALRREAIKVGVRSIPAFLFGSVYVVGCQPYEVLAKAAERAGARQRTS